MQGPEGPEPWQLSDVTAVRCFLREAEAMDVSVRMISDINTHVMLLGSNAFKLVPCREVFADSEHLWPRGIQCW